MSSETPPHVELDLPDRLIVHKPPGWEVDTTDAGDARHLSTFLRLVLPWPLSQDAAHGYGFLHRLDTPSSGLILVAKTFQAYYDLKFQLTTEDLTRDYIVLSHGLLSASGLDIDERVYYWRHDGGLPSTVCSRGRPSQTCLRALGQCRRAHILSLLAVRIRTGRRHQIRAHTLHVDLPTVCDGKYAATRVFIVQGRGLCMA
uniref:Pseudouridine synthase RsuA/RluA-like domain-containing protein n=1 Tax=Pyrodinium bahamense TaxID=73915 RepID=A0A7S0FV93_9DINO|mmetsp:Transcript_46568/g.129545  ORF Transcript_46568/g.129545 Transcript_46568/m.129545 type:complete len:201 (+) Transcript_46568:384-986(+)